jgi:ribosomal protein S18 acetylase RimI-like enzyme
MDDTTLAARQCASQMAVFVRNIGSAGEVLRPADGVVATLVAAVPDRSLPNSVVYRDAAAVSDAVLDELGAAYDAAGVRAWTVWVRPGDDALAARLVTRGHVHDASPLLMAGELDAMDIVPRATLEWEADADWALMGRLNDRAYGLPGDFERLGAAMRDDHTRRWVARVDGAPAGCVGIHVHEGDAEVWMVAVVPEARGRGLSAEILRHALSAARAAGATTTSLEATAMGEPVYRALGYRGLGRFGMWEKRRPA